ncbi:unnamed protein product [Cyprideis torosa]|uniref:Uncharacterized protein n=1 Tax=Cyprideis torosa TaxID=163714 RepID=A0A7R8WFN5_9CRUS|nr:unnamed protein product [Cyprideis torosa]CAG0894350.1 unnamed protein product [Cyprideis torosa]
MVCYSWFCDTVANCNIIRPSCPYSVPSSTSNAVKRSNTAQKRFIDAVSSTLSLCCIKTVLNCFAEVLAASQTPDIRLPMVTPGVERHGKTAHCPLKIRFFLGPSPPLPPPPNSRGSWGSPPRRSSSPLSSDNEGDGPGGTPRGLRSRSDLEKKKGHSQKDTALEEGQKEASLGCGDGGAGGGVGHPSAISLRHTV